MRICDGCKYAAMYFRKKGVWLTPESCDLHTDELCPWLDEQQSEEDGYKMYVKYRGDCPVAFRYGEEWEATALFVDGGYPTSEEALAAWHMEREQWE